MGKTAGGPQGLLWEAEGNWAVEMGVTSLWAAVAPAGREACRVLVRRERGPPALLWHPRLSALSPAVQQLCPFPDPAFGEILRSGLNHFLSRPHSQLWESGPGQRPGSFLTLLVPLLHLPSIQPFLGLGCFLNF